MDWKTINERLQAELEESRKQRETIRAAEDRAAEREQRRRATPATVMRPEPPAPAPTSAEKKAAAADALFSWMTQARPAEDQPAEQPRAADGTFAALSDRAKAAKARSDDEKARSVERATALTTFQAWLGRQRRNEQ